MEGLRFTNDYFIVFYCMVLLDQHAICTSTAAGFDPGVW
jgi:hypothetical protein